MKNSLTWRNRAHTLTAEQSRAEQSRAEQSRAEQSSKQLLCRFLLSESKYLDEKTHFRHGVVSCREWVFLYFFRTFYRRKRV